MTIQTWPRIEGVENASAAMCLEPGTDMHREDHRSSASQLALHRAEILRIHPTPAFDTPARGTRQLFAGRFTGAVIAVEREFLEWQRADGAQNFERARDRGAALAGRRSACQRIGERGAEQREVLLGIGAPQGIRAGR